MSLQDRQGGNFDGAPVDKEVINRDDSYTTSKELVLDTEKLQNATRTKLEWEMAVTAERKRMKADEKIKRERAANVRNVGQKERG